MPRLIIPAALDDELSFHREQQRHGGDDRSGSSITSSRACSRIRMQHEDDERLAERRDGGGDVRGALQLARAGDERAEEDRGDDRRERMELREERDGDPGVAVAGGEALEEPVRDAEELDPARKPGGRAGEGHGTGDLGVTLTPARARRRSR